MSTSEITQGVRSALAVSGTQDALTTKHLWYVLVRRRYIILGVALASILLVGTYCIFAPRLYRATGTVQVEKESSDALGLDALMSGAGGSSDALDGNINLQTQAKILESDTLALKTIKDLKLEGTEDFQSGSNLVLRVVELLHLTGPTEDPNLPLENAPRRRERVLEIFGKHLSINSVAGTRLIQIDYLSSDPDLSARIVNGMAQGLMDYTFQTRYGATAKASEWLSGQLTDLRKQSENLQAKVAQLQRESGVFSLGSIDAQGREQTYSATIDRLQQVTAAMNQAGQNRVLKGAIYQAAKSGNAEMISGLGGSAMSGGYQGMGNSLSVIQNLRQQQATLQAQLAHDEAKFGPAYPKLAELRSNISGLEEAIQQEGKRLTARAKNDYEVAIASEADISKQYEALKRQANVLNDKAIEYAIVRQEAEQSRGLYEDLLKRLKEAGVLVGLRSTNITVVSPGRVPAKPAKPLVALYLAGSLIGGLLLGCGGAYLVDLWDNTVYDINMLEQSFGQTMFAIIPAFTRLLPTSEAGQLQFKTEGQEDSSAENGAENKIRPKSLAVLESPRSPYAEAIRAMRTSLMFSRGGAPPKVLLVTGPVGGEGKTTLSASLAVLLAQHGKKVLIVDTDLRRSSLHLCLGIASDSGLSLILSGQTEPNTIVPIPELPGLSAVLAGPTPPYPTELLGSEHMRDLIDKWRVQYDIILLDGTPVLPVTDSVILSTLADVTLLVARYNMTERQSLERSYRLLQSQNPGQRIGIVVNDMKHDGEDYYSYYGYNHSTYHMPGDKHADA